MIHQRETIQRFVSQEQNFSGLRKWAKVRGMRRAANQHNPDVDQHNLYEKGLFLNVNAGNQDSVKMCVCYLLDT